MYNYRDLMRHLTGVSDMTEEAPRNASFASDLVKEALRTTSVRDVTLTADCYSSCA